MGIAAQSTYAYLGPQGTYSHQAALLFLANDGVPLQSVADVLLECGSISEIFELVDSGRAKFGVVPIENALEGSVNETLDAFVFNSKAQIRAEVVLDIHHNLIAAAGVKLTDIKTITSHPQALGQVRRWQQANIPAVATLATTSTAEAVRLAATDKTLGAIGSQLAAELFGGAVVAEQIEDHFGNQTRFVLIGTNGVPRDPEVASYKTSLALFMHEDRPGTLLMILEEFAYAGLNLTKIQSRPTKRALGDYMFWADVDGHADDAALRTALDCLRLKLREVKVIGSYPAVY